MQADLQAADYPVTFAVDYPDRDLDRATSIFRLIVAIPIVVVLGAVSGPAYQSSDQGSAAAVTAGGILFLGPLLMILFRQKYPRWWFDWNLQLSRFASRVGVYLLLMDDRYPATDDDQAVHLELPYPAATEDLNRWLPLVKWLLALPHYIVLGFLWLGLFFTTIVVWFAILFTGRYPRGLFGFAEGVMRWTNRVGAYAFLLLTDRYPPFRLRP